ncbi:MAG: MBOAT family protein [Clostridia bacterium]|nr:MBOAT family protein [Clostridia bacterium]
MSFDTIAYALFLPAVVGLHALCPARWRYLLLLVCSLLFYASWSPPLTLAILGVVAWTYLGGLFLEKAKRPSLRRLVLVISVTGCLGLLFYFKYLNFFMTSFCALLGGRWDAREILLPVGCSFYTFQALSYVVDVYRGKLRAERNPGFYALYICFFPQLVAGPIERAGDLMAELRQGRRGTREEMKEGLFLVLSGLFRKLAIADTVGPVVDRIFRMDRPDGSLVALGLLLFGFQIYCDFAGYSQIARGSARLLGIRLHKNFDRPYLSASPREFWRRWHVTLGTWFRDYVYIPLGGSRAGLPRQLLLNLLVFLLSGLWHSARWTFVVWGLYHGLLVVGEILLTRGRRPREGRAWKVLSVLLTDLLVMLGWLFFRAGSMEQAFTFFRALLSPWQIVPALQALAVPAEAFLQILLALGLLPLVHRIETGKNRRAITCFYLVFAVTMAFLLRAESGIQNAFIYFQF